MSVRTDTVNSIVSFSPSGIVYKNLSLAIVRALHGSRRASDLGGQRLSITLEKDLRPAHA